MKNRGLPNSDQVALDQLDGLILSADPLAVQEEIFFHLLPDEPEFFVHTHRCTTLCCSEQSLCLLLANSRPGLLFPLRGA